MKRTYRGNTTRVQTNRRDKPTRGHKTKETPMGGIKPVGGTPTRGVKGSVGNRGETDRCRAICMEGAHQQEKWNQGADNQKGQNHGAKRQRARGARESEGPQTGTKLESEGPLEEARRKNFTRLWV